MSQTIVQYMLWPEGRTALEMSVTVEKGVAFVSFDNTSMLERAVAVEASPLKISVSLVDREPRVKIEVSR